MYAETAMSQCVGIHVKDTKGVGMLQFQGGPWFHLPNRCQRFVKEGKDGLCDECWEKEGRSREKLQELTGMTVKGMLPSYLNGRTDKPIPYWTRLVGSAWFRLKLREGYTLSDTDMARAKKAVADAYGEAEPVAAPVPEGTRTKGRKKKEAAAEEPKLVEAVVPVPEEPKAVAAPVAVKGKRAPKAAAAEAPKPAPVEPEPAVVSPPPPKKRPAPAKKGVPTGLEPPVAVVNATATQIVEDVLKILVRKREIGDRTVFIDTKKGKVYDTKFRYLGRHDVKQDKIVEFPDSDVEA